MNKITPSLDFYNWLKSLNTASLNRPTKIDKKPQSFEANK